MKCKSCEAKNSSENSFCRRCGCELEVGESSYFSRRDFLKAAGAGVAGMGALTMLPSAKALTIRTNDPIRFLDGSGDRRHIFNQKVEQKQVSGDTEIDISEQNAFYHTVTGDVTYSFVRAFDSPSGSIFSLVIEQDSSGRHDIVWPDSVEWHQGFAPKVSDAPGVKHEFSFRSYDGGETWIGSLVASDIG